MIKDFFLKKLVPDKIEDMFKVEKEFIFHDLRDVKRTKKRGLPAGLRPWKNVTCLMLHQTGADIGSDPMRFLNIPAHSAITSEGEIVILNDPTKIMNHGHTPANKETIGIEISCRECGVVGDPRSFWVSKKEKAKGLSYDDLFVPATELQMEATIHLIGYYIDLAMKNGAEIICIMPHRSGHSSRTSDPGENIWKGVAIPAKIQYNLKYKDPVGSGTPIPTIWDPDQIGVPYNWQIKGY